MSRTTVDMEEFAEDQSTINAGDGKDTTNHRVSKFCNVLFHLLKRYHQYGNLTHFWHREEINSRRVTLRKAGPKLTLIIAEPVYNAYSHRGGTTLYSNRS